MISLPDAISLGFNRYSLFSGRSSRSEWWWWYLFTTVVGYGLLFVDGLLGLVFFGSGILSSIFGVAVLVPSIAMMVRRLHDINRSGWSLLWILTGFGGIAVWIWLTQPSRSNNMKLGPSILLYFVPVFGWIALIIWNIIRSGDEGDNQYGPHPR